MNLRCQDKLGTGIWFNTSNSCLLCRIDDAIQVQRMPGSRRTKAQLVRNHWRDALCRVRFFRPRQSVALHFPLKQVEKIREGIGAIESRFGKKSDQVWREYQEGKLGDDADIMEWVMLIENLRLLQNQCDRMAEIQTR